MKKALNKNEYIIRKIDDRYVFLRFENGDSHLLDETGTIFLDAYLNHSEWDDALEAICSYYDCVSEEIIKADFKEFIEALISKNILVSL